MGALSARNIILGQAEDAFVRQGLKSSMLFRLPTALGVDKRSSSGSRTGYSAVARCTDGKPQWLSWRR